jgi:hypothetical protein
VEDIGWSQLEIRAALSRTFGRDVDRQVGRAVSTAGTHAGTTFGTRMGSKASSVLHHHFTEAAKYIVGPLVGALAVEKIGELIKTSIEGASSLEAAQSRVHLILGKSDTLVSKFGEHAAKSYGLSKEQVDSAAASFAILFKQAKLSREENAKGSVQFTKLGADLAAFSHSDPEQTFVALQRGLAGATRGLKPYGILIDSAQQKAEALHLGLLKPVKDQAKIHSAQVAVLTDQVAYNKAIADHGKASLVAQAAEAKLGSAQETLSKDVEGTVPALTAQQKVLANRALILQQSTTQQGQFGRSNHTLYGQQRQLTASWKDAEERLGKGLLPVATDLVRTINKHVIPAVDDASKWFEHKGAPAIHHFEHELKPLVESALPALKTGLLDGYHAGKKLLPIAKGIFDAFNSLPGWAQKAVLITGGAGILAKKAGLLSVGRNALTGGLVSRAAPVPVLVTNPGFGAPGSPGGPSVVTTGAKVKTGLEAGSRAEKVASAAAEAAAEAKAAGAGVVAQSAAAARAGKAAAAAFDEAALKGALSFGGKGLLRGLLGAPLPALGSQVITPNAITGLGGVTPNSIGNRPGGLPIPKTSDVDSWAKLDQILSRITGRGGISKVQSEMTVLANAGDAIAGDQSGFGQLDALLPSTTAKLARFTQGTYNGDHALRNLGMGHNSTIDLVTNNTRKMGIQLASLPKAVQTAITTPGLIQARSDVQDLNRKFQLTPKQVRTEYQLTGLAKARADFDALHAHMGRQADLRAEHRARRPPTRSRRPGSTSTRSRSTPTTTATSPVGQQRKPSRPLSTESGAEDDHDADDLQDRRRPGDLHPPCRRDPSCCPTARSRRRRSPCGTPTPRLRLPARQGAPGRRPRPGQPPGRGPRTGRHHLGSPRRPGRARGRGVAVVLRGHPHRRRRHPDLGRRPGLARLGRDRRRPGRTAHVEGLGRDPRQPGLKGTRCPSVTSPPRTPPSTTTTAPPTAPTPRPPTSSRSSTATRCSTAWRSPVPATPRPRCPTTRPGRLPPAAPSRSPSSTPLRPVRGTKPPTGRCVSPAPTSWDCGPSDRTSRRDRCIPRWAGGDGHDLPPRLSVRPLKREQRTMSDRLPIDLAYAAGIIDGEGYIGITESRPTGRRRSPQFRCLVVVQMCGPEVPVWLAENFGGTVHAYPPRQPGHKGSHRWVLQDRRAVVFCALLEPHLRVKGDQARLLGQFYADQRFNFTTRQAIPEDEVLGRREYVTTIQGLNARSTNYGGQ